MSIERVRRNANKVRQVCGGTVHIDRESASPLVKPTERSEATQFENRALLKAFSPPELLSPAHLYAAPTTQGFDPRRGISPLPLQKSVIVDNYSAPNAFPEGGNVRRERVDGVEGPSTTCNQRSLRSVLQAFPFIRTELVRPGNTARRCFFFPG